MDNLDLPGLDSGKSTFHLIGHDGKNKELLRKKAASLIPAAIVSLQRKWMPDLEGRNTVNIDTRIKFRHFC